MAVCADGPDGVVASACAVAGEGVQMVLEGVAHVQAAGHVRWRIAML